MTTVLLLIHLFVTLALIGVVLIQRSEGGGLGIGTSQGMGSFMTGRGTANLLTRSTAILATIFMALSLTLALMNRGTGGVGRSILDAPAASGSVAPAKSPAVPTGAPVAVPGPTETKPASPVAAPLPAVPLPAVPLPAVPAPAAPAPATPAPTPAPAGPTVPTN